MDNNSTLSIGRGVITTGNLGVHAAPSSFQVADKKPNSLVSWMIRPVRQTPCRWIRRTTFPNFIHKLLANMSQYTLNINGGTQTLNAEPETPLLWILRDSLMLIGSKFGCGIGQCGACTVHLDGMPTRSCITPVSEVAGRQVTTIEGLSENGDHPLQRAWQELDVPQCGYCQAGQIMSAAALLKKSPHPSDSEIDAALDGNLCRCGTYLRIRAGIHRAAELAGKEAV